MEPRTYCDVGNALRFRPIAIPYFLVAVRRFETPPGKQAQVDWGHLGSLEWEGQEQKLWAFTFTLGYSRRLMAEVALDQKIGTLLRMHEEAFRQMGPHEDGVARQR